MKYTEQSTHELKRKAPRKSEEERRVEALEAKAYFGTVRFRFCRDES